jgi:L-ascorbate metabolism protein UlaG (beta-lactamase superfamily)/truncated hemoglobin YjbI
MQTPPRDPGHPEVRGSTTLLLVGGPTLLIEWGGLRMLTDPTFDPTGEYPIGSRALVKIEGPAVPATDLPAVDVVLISHDQHPDNLDRAGREVAALAPLVCTTVEAADRLGDNAIGLAPWTSTRIDRPDGGPVTITAVPAHHGPDGTARLTGSVTGFVLSGDGLPTLYVSGDNASLGVVQEVADHQGPIDVAVLFAGAARTPLLDAYLTLTSVQAVRAARILDPAVIVPIHLRGWAHFTQGPETVRAAFAAAGLSDQLVLLEPGDSRCLRPREHPQDDHQPSPTIFEAAGGADGMLRLAHAWHRRVMADEVVAHAFSHGFHPQHTERLAAYWGEALGGPPTYTARYGDESAVVRMHSGNGVHEAMDRRAIACFDQALVDAGMARDATLGRALHDYFAWATATSMARYHDSADDVPSGLAIPVWSWNGLRNTELRNIDKPGEPS